MSTRARVAVLASGGGSNLQAIIEYFADASTSPVEISWVGSNRAGAGALERARTASIPCDVIDPADGNALLDHLERHRIDILALAGYLRLIPPEVITGFGGPIVNIHPALLPAFGGRRMYGMRVHEAVVASGTVVTGATVHLVNDNYDEGPIVGQWPVPVFPSDSAETVAARVLEVEHQLYPVCIELIARGRLPGSRGPSNHVSGSHDPSNHASGSGDPANHASGSGDPANHANDTSTPVARSGWFSLILDDVGGTADTSGHSNLNPQKPEALRHAINRLLLP